MNLVLKLAKFIACFSYASGQIYSISLGSLELCRDTQICFSESHTLTLLGLWGPESVPLTGRFAHFRKLHGLLYLGYLILS